MESILETIFNDKIPTNRFLGKESCAKQGSKLIHSSWRQGKHEANRTWDALQHPNDSLCCCVCFLIDINGPVGYTCFQDLVGPIKLYTHFISYKIPGDGGAGHQHPVHHGSPILHQPLGPLMPTYIPCYIL